MEPRSVEIAWVPGAAGRNHRGDVLAGEAPGLARVGGSHNYIQLTRLAG
jgi:hypothetical protein